MEPVRAAALAGLVLAAFALPVTAYALTEDAGTPTASPPHVKKPKPAKPAKTAEPGDDATENEDAAEPSAAGRAHAEAMKAWAHCVAEAASGPKTGARTGPAKLACGDKPMAPGRAKHLAAGTGPFAPGKGHADQQKSHAKTHGRSSHQ